MVKKNVLMAIAEAQQRYMGYLAMEAFQYSNICVKHDPSALLPAVILYNGMEKRIEDVAKVSMGDEENPDDEYKLYVYPEDIDMLVPIIEAVMEVHPEFKIDILSDDEEENTIQENTATDDVEFGAKDFEPVGEKKDATNDDDMPKYRYICYTMPPVTKKIRDAYTETVKGQSKVTQGKYEVEKKKLQASVAAKIVGYTKADSDKAKKMVDDVHEQYCKQEQTLTEEKLQEIEAGYQFYCKRHPEESAKENVEDAKVVNDNGKESTGGNSDKQNPTGNIGTMLKL